MRLQMGKLIVFNLKREKSKEKNKGLFKPGYAEK